MYSILSVLLILIYLLVVSLLVIVYLPSQIITQNNQSCNSRTIPVILFKLLI